MQREISGRAVSLGSFSEAQAVFVPEVLEHVLKELAQQVARSGQSLSGMKRVQWQAVIIDSSWLSRFAAHGMGAVASPASGLEL